MRRARSQLSKLTQQQTGNPGMYNAQGMHVNSLEADEIQRRLNAMHHQQSMMGQQQQPMFNDPAQNFGFPQAMPSNGFQQPMAAPSMPMQPYPQQAQPAANPYASAMPASSIHATDSIQPQNAYEPASPQLDNIKSALEQMSSKLHAINHSNASGGANNQNAILQQSEILKQHYNHINAELQGLKASIANLGSSEGSNSDLQVIQETLSANYRAIMQQLETAQPAQIDNSIFSAALEASHNDLSKQILDMQQSIETASNNPNIYAKTLEASHEDITKRLDDMHNALQTSIATPDIYVDSIQNNHNDLSQQISGLQQTIENLENGSTEASSNDISNIEMRLEEITRAVVALSLEDGSINNLERIEARVSDIAKTLDGFEMPQVTQPAQTDDASFERLEAKLSDISALMQASTPDLSNVESEIAKFSEKFENFSAVSMASPISGEENNALLQRMDELVEQISNSQAQSANTTSNDAITAQLAQISGAIDKLSAPSQNQSSNDDVIVKQLDQIAGAIDQLSVTSSQSMTDNQFASLEQQLSLIAGQMDGSTPSASLSLDPITSRLAGIEEQLGANRDITIELATKAAEDAVKMSMEAMPQMAASGVPMDGAALNSMSDILAQLNQDAQHNNTKNVEAFGAVTDTLNLMVERLGSIEAGLSGQNYSAPFVQETPSLEPAQDFNAPIETHQEHIDVEVEAAELVEEPQATKRSPAADLVQAARLASSEAKVSIPDAQPTMAIKEPILDTMVENEQLAVPEPIPENIPLPEVETPDMAMEKLPEVKDELPAESGPDVALEPGTGGPDLAALVRQANERRKNNKGADVESSGTDFIAAARRAAQAAAQEAGAVEEEIEEKTKKSLFASLPELFAKRKKVIIMAAAAALFIAVAGAIVPKFLGGGSDQVATIDNSVTIDQSANPVLPQASAVPPQDTVTPIVTTPEADVAEVPETDAPNVQTQAQDFPQNANLVNVDLDANPAPASASFELPDELYVVTPDLKQAVQNGEPAALFEIGKQYTDGTVVGKDLVKAAEWYERAADLGFAPAQYIIGNFNEKGLGIDQNPEVAAQWYEKAAKGGNIIAMHNLAVLTATPNALTEQPNMEEAFKWFSNAADYGVRDSQVNAGIFHTKGFGTEVNLIEAYKWFAIAAKAGDKDAGNKRDVIANAMPPDQLEIAKSLVKEWKPLDVVKAANEVSVNDAWKSAAPVAVAPLKIDRNTIAQTQSLLSKVGFNAGVADGVMGQKTRNAIAAFQKKAGLPVNGRIDAEFLKALKAVAI